MEILGLTCDKLPMYPSVTELRRNSSMGASVTITANIAATRLNSLRVPEMTPSVHKFDEQFAEARGDTALVDYEQLRVVAATAQRDGENARNALIDHRFHHGC
jgi:hypothetical protein